MANKSAKKKSSGSPNKNQGAASVKKKETAFSMAEKKAEQIVAGTDKTKAAAKKSGKKSGGIKQYFRDLRSEFKKVVWPSRKAVINNTSVVIIAMVISAIFIWGLDSGYVALLNLVVNH